jgi:histidinol dehydrogenase
MKYFELNEAKITDELNNYLNDEDEINFEVEKTILEISQNIRKNGFKAVREYTKKFDNFDLNESNFRVSESEISELAKKINPELSQSLEIAVNRVKDFHKNEIEKGFTYKDKHGNPMGQKVTPLESVAVYVPGGRALYPSSIYMTIIPALIAGVKRIVLLSPPRTFIESPEVAKLVELLGIEEIYRIGGAQAVLSAAYGLPNLKSVDKIVGPGNIFVATAKRFVYGKVDIDMIAGPSEILVIADTNKDEDISLIATDLLSQAEHDPMARPILVGFDKNYLSEIEKKCYEIAKTLPNKENTIKSLDNRSLIIKCPDKFTGIEISNLLAPEHLEIFSYDPYPIFDKVKNAGSVFIGRYTPESVGDYLGGPNHVLPTSRTSRFFSPLGVYDFQKRFSFIEFSKDSLELYYKNIALIARSEKLEAHARAAEVRFK